jgi:hypothetical protein
MRPTATVALILAVGLVAAACGGDDATPKPEEPTAAPAATEASVEATEAPGEATEAPAEATPEPEPEFAKKAAITSEDDPETTFGLTSGRYRLAWDTQAADAASDGCERVEVAVVQQDGDFEYIKPSTSARFNATVNDLPEGTYKLEQRDPACETWQVRIDWMTN